LYGGGIIVDDVIGDEMPRIGGGDEYGSRGRRLKLLLKGVGWSIVIVHGVGNECDRNSEELREVQVRMSF